MIAVGGAILNGTELVDDTPNNILPDHSLPDPWPQGIGVFDMTEMKWRDNYDPKSQPYKIPNTLKAYYQRNGLYPAGWSSPSVQQWFTVKNTTTPSSSQGQTQSQKTQSNRKIAGAIAGGTVGGIFLLTIIAILAFVFFRRRRQRNRESGGAYGKEFMASDEGYEQRYADNRKHEPIELPQSPMQRRVGELEGVSKPKEMAGSPVPGLEHKMQSPSPLSTRASRNTDGFLEDS